MMTNNIKENAPVHHRRQLCCTVKHRQMYFKLGAKHHVVYKAADLLWRQMFPSNCNLILCILNEKASAHTSFHSHITSQFLSGSVQDPTPALWPSVPHIHAECMLCRWQMYKWCLSLAALVHFAATLMNYPLTLHKNTPMAVVIAIFI